MLTLGIILAYLLVGTLVGRKMFVYLLDGAPRYETIISTYWSDAFVRAFWVGCSSILFWPVIGFGLFLLRETPHEAKERRKKELETLESEIKRLEKEYGLDFRK